FGNLAPPFPRDLALVSLIAFLFLLVAGIRRRDHVLLAAGGVVLGLALLTGEEASAVGLGVAAMAVLAYPALGRGRTALALFAPPVALAAIWLIPLGINYLRLGGFVNITLVGPADLTAVAIVGAWGISVAFGAYGFVRYVRKARDDDGPKVVLLVLIVTGGLLAISALIPVGLGEAFAAIGRRHRYWPYVHLSICLYAALGATALLDAARRWRRWAPVPLVAVTTAVSLASPMVASLALPSKENLQPRLPNAVRGDPDALLNVVGARRAPCVAAVPPTMDSAVFSYTGYRLVLYRWGEYRENLARIRWRNIYERIPDDAARRAANQAIRSGGPNPEGWRRLVDAFGVDVIVVARKYVDAPAFAEARRLPTEEPPYEVMWVGDCS
ncbi:MAG: hypothetical protein ABR518_00160, partial [Actinomycetota bacterium]